MDFKKDTFLNYLKGTLSRNAADLTPQELHNAVGEMVMNLMQEDWEDSRNAHASGRRAYYLSMEFLMGRSIFNNLLCLGIYDEVEAALNELGTSLTKMEEIEDAALGNGGLGRLAACFLDSAATLNLPLDGYGIRYKYGLFKQEFKDGFQCETADDWTRFGDAWSIRRDDETVLVKYSTMTVKAVPYDMPVIGYGTKNIGTLRLWQAEPVKEFDFHTFNDQKYLEACAEKIYAENISRCLYPNDDSNEGKKLRLQQEYFFSSASLQDILKDLSAYLANGGDINTYCDDLAESTAIPGSAISAGSSSRVRPLKRHSKLHGRFFATPTTPSWQKPSKSGGARSLRSCFRMYTGSSSA